MLRVMLFLVILLYLLSVLFPQLNIGVILSILSLTIVLVHCSMQNDLFEYWEAAF